jgi:hypothetical protein
VTEGSAPYNIRPQNTQFWRPRVSILQIPRSRPRQAHRFARQPQHLGGILDEMLAAPLVFFGSSWRTKWMSVKKTAD